MKKELWSFRTTVKRIARDIVLQHYDLTPSKHEIEEWCLDNDIVLQVTESDMAARNEAVKIMRKKRVAELTGVGDAQILAVFAYESSVSYHFATVSVLTTA